MLNQEEFEQRAQGVRLLVVDVDGVLTDGGIVVDDQGRETKRFHVRDGFGIRCWQRGGGRVAIITGRFSGPVAFRGRELGIDPVLQRVADKGVAFRRLLESLKLDPRQACVLGDDLPDLPMMLASGLAVAVADAAPEVREAADWVTEAGGGQGAVRELIEKLLAAQGRWNTTLELYRKPA